jgi:hypothetical protein
MSDDLSEWREHIGVQIMHATKCTHEGADFGDRGVCVTCFDNTQRLGALIEREVAAVRRSDALASAAPDALARVKAEAWERGRVAGASHIRRQWSDEPNAPEPVNPYRADRIARGES